MLIISIIVMLILVGVTVTVSLNGGLFEKTREATQRTSREKAIEELNIITADFNADLYVNPEKYYDIDDDGKDFNIIKLFAEIETRILGENNENPNSYSITDLDLENYKNAEEEFSLFKEIASDYYILDIQFVYKGVRADWEIKIAWDDNYNEDEIEYIELVLEEKTETTLISVYEAGKECTDENCTNENHLHKGDYVKYTPTKVTTAYDPDRGEGTGTYTGYTTEPQRLEQETLNWRVLGVDDNNNILLISRAPTTAELTLYGHVGYNNCESVLKETCEALYSNKELGATARSITMDDIDTYLGGDKYDKSKFGQNDKSVGEYGAEYTINDSYFDYDVNSNTLNKVTELIPITFTLNYFSYRLSDVPVGDLDANLITGGYAKNTSRLFWISYRGIARISGITFFGCGFGSLGDANEWVSRWIFYGIFS